MTPTILQALAFLPRDATDAERATAVAEALGVGWRPIESAPFDIPILVRTDRGSFVACAWSDDPDRDGYDRGQRFCVDDGKTEHGLRGPYPAHWMPLPPPPLASLPPRPDGDEK